MVFFYVMLFYVIFFVFVYLLSFWCFVKYFVSVFLFGMLCLHLRTVKQPKLSVWRSLITTYLFSCFVLFCSLMDFLNNN